MSLWYIHEQKAWPLATKAAKQPAAVSTVNWELVCAIGVDIGFWALIVVATKYLLKVLG
jgi:hypothetical protein